MTVIEKLQMNANQANSDFVAIKNKIVEKGVEVADGTRTAEYASKVDEVYEQGKKSQYDEFWDAYQDNGMRSNYENAFGGHGWNAETLKPKYDLVNMSNINQMFYVNKSEIDLVETFEKAGIIFDMKSSYSCSTMFSTTNFTRVGVVDLTNTGAGVYSIFANSEKLRTIDKLIIPDRTFDFNNWFGGCSSLENLTIEGVIANNGFNVQWSTKLSKASWVSIINALSQTASGLSITGSLESVRKAFETYENELDGTASEEWLNLIATKSNWTVNLI